MESVTFHLPNGSHYGPYFYRVDADLDRTSPHGGAVEKNDVMAERINTLLALPPQRMADTTWWCQPPAMPGEYVLVLVRRRSKQLRGENRPIAAADVYVVELPKSNDEAVTSGPGMTLDMIKTYVCEVFGSNALSEDSLRPCKSYSVKEHDSYYSGSVLVGEPPSRLPPIKPSDDQPVVKPAEESPHNSFDSRRSVGEAGVLVPPQRVVAPSALPSLDKEEVPCKENVPFLHSRGGDEVEMRKRSRRDRLEEVSEVNTNSTLTTISSYGKDLDSVKGIYKKSQEVEGGKCSIQQSNAECTTQDYITGQSPLKLLQQRAYYNTNGDNIEETVADRDEEEYRSLPLELFQYAKDVEVFNRKAGKESASFPGACQRRCVAKKNVQRSVNFEDERKKREMKEEDAVSPGQNEAELKKFQDKLHILEHVYNGECFLKRDCKKPPSISSESYKEIEEMARAHREGTLGPESTELLKGYITAHCQRCSDTNCKVPHMAAGCPQPGVLSNVELTFNQPTSASRIGSTQNPAHQPPDQCHNLTDGNRVFMQATDDHTPGPCDQVYVRPARPQISDKSLSSAGSSVDNRAIHVQATEEEKEEMQLEEMRNGHFPSVDACRCQVDSLIKTLVYCSQALSESTGYTFGSSVAGSLQVSHCLGEGGNGRVYQCSLNQRQLAAKFTHYRQRELRIWSSLEHENLTALRGVVLVPLCRGGVYVYQLMPLMTSTFQKEVDKVHNLQSLICSKRMLSRTILKNTYHICRELVKGICHLHRNNIYHGDLKGSNIFILKQPSCQCNSAFLCMCPPELKCKVRIGDFDSADYFTPDYDGDGVPDRIKVLHTGTLFYRSPEAHIGHMGPWCDTWSIGCMILYTIMGHPKTSEIRKAYGDIKRNPSTLHHYNPLLILLMEIVNPFIWKYHLMNICKDTPELELLARIADACLHLDFHKRSTAEELLNMLLHS